MKKTSIICLALFLCACTHSELATLKGKTSDDIRLLKGEPVTILSQEGNQMWTYRTNECTQIIFFDKNQKASDWYEMGTCLPKE